MSEAPPPPHELVILFRYSKHRAQQDSICVLHGTRWPVITIEMKRKRPSVEGQVRGQSMKISLRCWVEMEPSVLNEEVPSLRIMACLS